MSDVMAALDGGIPAVDAKDACEIEGEQPFRFKWEQALRDDRRLTTSEKAVALLMATWGDLDGTSIFVGVGTLVEAAGLSERSVRRIRKSLREFGWLRETPRSGKSSLYELRLPAWHTPVMGDRGDSHARGIDAEETEDGADKRPSPFLAKETGASTPAVGGTPVTGGLRP